MVRDGPSISNSVSQTSFKKEFHFLRFFVLPVTFSYRKL